MDTRYLPTTLDGKIARYLEEIGETLQVLGKIGRNGMVAQDPYTGIAYDNRAALRREIKDLQDAAERLDSALADVDTYSPSELRWHQERSARGRP